LIFRQQPQQEGLFYPPDPGEKTASIGGNVITNAGGMKAVRYGLTRDFVRCIEAVMPDGSIMNFSSNVVKNTTGYDVKRPDHRFRGNPLYPDGSDIKTASGTDLAPVRWLCRLRALKSVRTWFRRYWNCRLYRLR
jgi:FAD/FMN-containing dehydrogenase